MLNPDYNVDIFCIWCKKEWVLDKGEIWVKRNICPSCGKEMGFPEITHGSKRNDQNMMVEYHRADYYLFEVLIHKTKLVKFIEKLMLNGGICHSIYAPESGQWVISMSLNKSFEFEGVKFIKPPIWRGV